MTRREAGFTTLFVVLVALALLPPFFPWSNRIEPRVFGFSFAIAWQVGLALLMSLTLIVWYLVDDRSGDLDIGSGLQSRTAQPGDES